MKELPSKAVLVPWFIAAAFFGVALAGLLDTFSNNIRVDRAGGAYAFSPDGRWQATIEDGFCEDNQKRYAVLNLWDLEKYPSLARESIHAMWGKKPEVKLVFPKDFSARGSGCKVVWTNANEFEVRFVSEKQPQVLQYNVAQNTFSLGPQEPPKE